MNSGRTRIEGSFVSMFMDRHGSIAGGHAARVQETCG
jgi:hypothetical protein